MYIYIFIYTRIFVHIKNTNIRSNHVSSTKKDPHICTETEMYMKRNLHYEKRPTNMNRDRQTLKETYKHEQRPTNKPQEQRRFVC